MELPHLQPDSSTPLERTLSASTDVYERVGANVTAMRRLKLGNPPPSWLPFLVYEYGLGELQPYVPNLYELIDEGIDWQRVRGTPASVFRALGWLGYSAALDEAPPRRRFWNVLQIALERVRDNEADLIRIDGVTTLSLPKRSTFWRGYHGYDVRALEWGRTRWGQTLWSAYSGARIPQSDVKWSFGRPYDIDHAMTQAELQALGVWIEPTGEIELGWDDIPWPDAPWTSDAEHARSVAMLAAVPAGTAWAVFRDADGAVIGYRRARARWPVRPAPGGIYAIGSNRYAVELSGATRLYVEAMTDFGDGFGSTAFSVGFVLSAVPAAGFAPGARWLPAGGIVPAGPVVAETPVSIEFGRTVRERVRAVLRF